MAKAISKLFFERIGEEFKSQGFKKRNKYDYEIALSELGIFGTVFIGSYSRAGVFAAYIVAGVRDKEIEEEMLICLGHGPRSAFLSCISAQIRKYAMPFFDEYGSREKIHECFNLKKYVSVDALCFRLPIALNLNGQGEMAKAYVLDHLAALQADGSWVLDQYQQFSDRLMARASG